MQRRPRSFLARDGRTVLLGSIAEDALLTQTLQWCRRAGLCALHIRYSQGVLQGAHGPRSASHDDASGYPDLLIIRPGEGVLWRELKRENGRLTPDQRRWGELLRGAGQDWDVWRPSDEARIRRELRLNP